jgi:hypothetical protein
LLLQLVESKAGHLLLLLQDLLKASAQLDQEPQMG